MQNPLGNSNGIMCGDQHFSLPAHMNYGKVILDQLLTFKNKLAFINGVTGEQTSYSDLAQMIVNAAAALKRLGVTCGDVVAICSENRIEFIVTAIATFISGAVLTFFHHEFSTDELLYSANISKPKYVFLSPDAYKTHYDTLNDLKMIKNFFVFGQKDVVYQGNSIEDFAKEHVDILSLKPFDFNGRTETALILYSSGTTGLPKGVQLSHLGLIITTYQPKTTLRDLTILTVAPWCNSMGILTTSDALVNGRTIVFLPKFVEKSYLETIEKYKVGFLLVAPSMIAILCKSALIKSYDMSSVQFIHSGGASVNLDIVNDVNKRFPNLHHVLQGYGTTETTGIITREVEGAVRKGSVGKITAGVILKIVDIESRKILGPRQPGEVCVKGQVLFNGYIGRPLEQDLDEQGFFRTGDVAYYDEDEYLYIVDRLKALIKYKTWQISPTELEEILLHHPAVEDAGVVGAPDSTVGELPTAFIVTYPEANITAKELIDYVASKVSPWKQIRGGVRFVQEIPKNGNGKILRRLLRKQLA